jgi:uncharacterized protein
MLEIKKKKGILIGDYAKAQYHPLTQVDERISDIFKDEIDITCTEEYDMLLTENLINFDLCILYVDRWGQEVSETIIRNLADFVKKGGGLLVIHNGISFQSNAEFAELVGGKFTGHPAYTNLEIKITNSKHPIMEGIREFAMDEEPYRYDFNSFNEKEILFEYIHEGNIYPAAWTKVISKGRLVYLMPGHNVDSFKNEIYGRIILRSGMWALGKI